MKVFFSEQNSLHDPEFFLQRGHVRRSLESPARIDVLLQAAKEFGLDIAPTRNVTARELEIVHARQYLDFLRTSYGKWSLSQDSAGELVVGLRPTPEMLAQGARIPAHIIGEAGWYMAEPNCPIGKNTWETALGAASVAIEAANDASRAKLSYALCRPPGHHAYAARAGGLCYLNNAALAAETLLRAGAKRVAILDIDSHHGNGTQGIYWERPDVFVVSVHGDPSQAYPWFVGNANERGGQAGQGYNLNLPLDIGSDDDTWIAAIEAGLQAIEFFAPEALVLSLGFDASEAEPYRIFSVTKDGFRRAGNAIGKFRKPITIVQEGGYAVEHLGGLLKTFLDGLLQTENR